MAFVTTNLGLNVWDQLSDTFNHTELVENWTAIDEHDHTGGGKGVQIPTAGIANNAITAPKVATNAVTTVNITDLSVTNDKLAAGAVTTAKMANGAGNPPVVTTLVAGTYDGQEVFLRVTEFSNANLADEILWHFRWRSSNSRWEFLGGPPAYSSASGAAVPSASTTWVPDSADLPLFLPYRGVYRVNWNCSKVNGSITATTGKVQVLRLVSSVWTAVVSGNQECLFEFTTSFADNYFSAFSQGTPSFLTTSDVEPSITIGIQRVSGTGTVSINNLRTISATPVYIPGSAL